MIGSPAPSAESTLLKALALFAGAVGAPGLAALWKPEIINNPKTIPLLIAWESFLLMVSFLTKVWGPLEHRWAERLANWADYKIQEFISRYYREYLLWISGRHRYFAVKGLTIQSAYRLEIEKLSIDPLLAPSPAHAIPENPVSTFQVDPSKRRTIWEYLLDNESGRHLAILGAQGSGKTILLQKIALQLAGHRLKIKHDFPILLFFRDHAQAILDNHQITLDNLASTDYSSKSGTNLPAAWFKKKLRKGRCLILLDGLDEVTDPGDRRKVVDWITNQIAAFGRSRFLISSRPHGLQGIPITSMESLLLLPFGRDQIIRYARRYRESNPTQSTIAVNGKATAPDAANDLLMWLDQSKELTDLAPNPLLLHIMATICQFGIFPKTRTELFAEICKVFLGERRETLEPINGLSSSQTQSILQTLAYHLMVSEKLELSVEESIKVIAPLLLRIESQEENPEAAFLKNVERASGLLFERNPGQYQFAHPAFQDYLAAAHIKEHDLATQLVEKIGAAWWNGVIRSYGALGNANIIIQACLERFTAPLLGLAFDILKNANNEMVNPDLRDEAESLLQRALESANPTLFRTAAKILLSRHLEDMASH